ncbi:MAG: helix-turn-helix domain-containing protein [Nostoc sp. EkiNYC01]|nr:helix-turn-helix transcriptional regulator [Nostoc sp. EkiNYC01]
MPRSIKIHPDHKQKVLLAIERNGFLTQGDLAVHLHVTLSTVSNFLNGKPVYISTFEKICEALGLDKRVITKSVGLGSDTPSEQSDSTRSFFSFDSFWVGREQLVGELNEKLRGSCRLLLILGLTGIGKTALAEKLVVDLEDWLQGDWKNKLRRVNFDNEVKPTNFVNVAAIWLEEWGDKVSIEDRKPELLLQKLVKYLLKNQVLVLIDSLERLLTGNEEDGWGDFVDEWWGKFFVSLLSAESCQSRVIVTSQDLPVKLVDFRYRAFWHRQVLYGLDESEQIALFDKTGLDISQESLDRPILLRIGKAYNGHPLVLRVIIGEICESFDSNVQAYWNDVSSKIEEVEKSLSEAEADARKIIVTDDDWKLHKLTRKVRLEVNKQRLKAVFERLETQVRDAYILICAASVYRAPVQEEAWIIQLVNFLKHLEGQECNEERQERALEELCNRFLAEESVNYNNKRVLGQHNLVRSVALEHNKDLLQSMKNQSSPV